MDGLSPSWLALPETRLIRAVGDKDTASCFEFQRRAPRPFRVPVTLPTIKGKPGPMTFDETTFEVHRKHPYRIGVYVEHDRTMRVGGLQRVWPQDGWWNVIAVLDKGRDVAFAVRQPMDHLRAVRHVDDEVSSGTALPDDGLTADGEHAAHVRSAKDPAWAVRSRCARRGARSCGRRREGRALGTGPDCRRGRISLERAS